jgi:hypothetical protein
MSHPPGWSFPTVRPRPSCAVSIGTSPRRNPWCHSSKCAASKFGSTSKICYALERQSGFRPGLRFVIPVPLESHPQLPLAELSQLHVIDLTAPGGIDDLAQVILDDWQTRQILRGI